MFSELTALFGVITTLLMLYIAFRVYRRPPPWVNSVIEDRLQGVETFIDHTLDSAFLEASELIDQKIASTVDVFMQPNENGQNFVDTLAARFGKGFRMSLLAQKSGEVRHEGAIEQRVFDAVKENVPEVKIGLKLAEKFGLGDLVETPQDAMAVMGVLKKYGFDVAGFMGKGSNSPNPGSGTIPRM